MNFPPIDDFEDTVVDVPVSTFDTVDVRGTHVEKRNPIQVIHDYYPRIYHQVALLWGTQELQNAFTHWLFGDQADRKGWPRQVAEALLELNTKHADIFGFDPQLNSMQWRDQW